MRSSTTRSNGDLGSLGNALVGAGLAVRISPPESGVQVVDGTRVERRHARAGAPWAEHLEAALAPTMLAMENGFAEVRAGEKLAGRAIAMTERSRGSLASSYLRVAAPLPRAAPVRVGPPPTKVARRGASRWPVRLCGLVAVAAAISAFLAAPHPSSARARAEVAVVTHVVAATSASIERKFRTVWNDAHPSR